jgi:hypothetical protein
MRVRISYTVDVDDQFRREINRWYGRPGLASREEVKRWFERNGSSMNDDLSLQADADERDEE